jgi:predicted ATPase
MYIQEIKIKNIRSIEWLDIKFPKPYRGWNVIIGDNGSGKSTFVRAVALGFIGPKEAPALRLNWKSWLSKSNDEGLIRLDVVQNQEHDKVSGKGKTKENHPIPAMIKFIKKEGKVDIRNVAPEEFKTARYLWGGGNGWFSASYGPFRRFSGGNKDWEKMFYSNPVAAPHLSAFGEDVALSESLEWIQDLHYRFLEKKPEGTILESLRAFINHGDFLPHKMKLESVSSEGLFFRDGNGNQISIEELSDGYRSVLSLTFELIRQLIKCYGDKKVFKNIQKGEYHIDLPGVVIIDEIDAHLHPTWQVRIGQWFTKYFPKLQFIVTTHSPLICHAVGETGSVWKLSAPGSDEQAKQVTGTDLKRLIYGNVLDAYGTNLFGEGVGRSEEGREKLDRLAKLNLKFFKGQDMTAKEKKEREELMTYFPSESSTF